MSSKIGSIDNPELEQSDLNQAINSDDPFEALVGNKDSHSDGEPKDVSHMSDRIDSALGYPESNILEIETNGSQSTVHVTSLEGFSRMVLTPENGEPQGFSTEDQTWFGEYDTVSKMVGKGCELGSNLIEQFGNMSFKVPTYLEFVDGRARELQGDARQEFQRISDCGPNNSNGKGFLGSSGKALTQLHVDNDSYGVIGSFENESAYSVEEAFELDYSIDVPMANESLLDLDQNFEEDEKEQIYRGLIDIASDTGQEDNTEEEWELGLYETNEESVLLYLEEHNEEEIQVLDYEADIESHASDISLSEGSKEYIEDKLDCGNYEMFARPLMDAVSGNPRIESGEADLDTVDVTKIVEPKDRDKTKFESTANEHGYNMTGSGDREARLFYK